MSPLFSYVWKSRVKISSLHFWLYIVGLLSRSLNASIINVFGCTERRNVAHYCHGSMEKGREETLNCEPRWNGSPVKRLAWSWTERVRRRRRDERNISDTVTAFQHAPGRYPPALDLNLLLWTEDGHCPSIV